MEIEPDEQHGFANEPLLCVPCRSTSACSMRTRAELVQEAQNRVQTEPTARERLNLNQRLGLDQLDLQNRGKLKRLLDLFSRRVRPSRDDGADERITICAGRFTDQSCNGFCTVLSVRHGLAPPRRSLSKEKRGSRANEPLCSNHCRDIVWWRRRALDNVCSA